VIGDLQGPKIRVGDLSVPMQLTSGDRITVVIGLTA
jgi:pyruvate kinase